MNLQQTQQPVDLGPVISLNLFVAYSICRAGLRMMDEKNSYGFLPNWIPVFIYCALIFIQSSRPAPAQIPHLPGADKLLHFAAYTFLGALLLRGFKRSRLRDYPMYIEVASILLTGIYGAFDELHQYYVPARSADVGDIFFDFVGGIFGVYCYQLLLEKYPRLRHI